MDAIEIGEYGGRETMSVVDRPVPEPAADQVRIDVVAAGINFADIMQRRGHYEGGPEPPFVPGMEVAGRIDAVGDAVGLEEGEEVVALIDEGGYAEYALADPQVTFPVPGDMSLTEAAGFPVQFLTAHNCLFEWGDLDADESVLIHAAAGGVGTAAVQLASRAGAEVFGTASTAAKLELAEELGCDHPINYTETDFATAVRDETDHGVDLVLDGVGGETAADSLDALRQFGRMVVYGAASGEPGELSTAELLFANQQVIGYHLGRGLALRPQRVMAAVPDLQQGLASGDLEIVLGERFDLRDAVAAHEHIESRASSGKVVLEP